MGVVSCYIEMTEKKGNLHRSLEVAPHSASAHAGPASEGSSVNSTHIELPAVKEIDVYDSDDDYEVVLEPGAGLGWPLQVQLSNAKGKGRVTQACEYA